jgi:hypothetical protein
VFYFGLALLFLFSLSSYFTGGLYARYTTSVVGEDTARVARFDVSNEISTENASINLNFYDPAKLTDTVQFRVESSSEVAVEYTVIVTLPEANVDYDVWLDVALTGDDGITQTKTGNTYVFEGFDAMAPGTLNQAAYTLSFKIKEACRGTPPSGLTNITQPAQITVHAQQID